MKGVKFGKSHLTFVVIYFVLFSLVAIFTNLTIVAKAGIANTQIVSTNFMTPQNTPVYPGSTNSQLRIEVKFNVNATNAYGQIGNLPSGISPSYNHGYTAFAQNLNGSTADFISSGTVVSFAFYLNVDKSVTPGTYYLNFNLTYNIEPSTSETDSFIIAINVSTYPALMLTLVNSFWNPAGYPGTHNTNLQITIENDGESTINNAIIYISLPSGFTYDGEPVQISALNSGERTTITFSNIDISSDTKPGTYEAKLSIDASLSTKDGVSYNASKSIYITFNITEIPPNLYSLRVLSLQWGAPSPQPIYSDSRYVELRATFINKGEKTILSAEILASSDFLIPIMNISSTSVSTPTGSAFTLSYYFDMNSSALFRLLTSSVPISFDVSYRVDLGSGAYVDIQDKFTASIKVENYVGTEDGRGVAIINADWNNGYVVYPNTNNAVYNVQIANRLPFTISGINITLFLPRGFSSNGCNISKTYYNGPLQSYSSTNVQLKIDVGDVSPGSYSALLLVDYIASSGGPGVRKFDIFNVMLKVSNEEGAIELISTTWREGSVGTYELGKTLEVSFRNLKYDQLSLPLLTMFLPPGFKFSFDNSSIARIFYYNVPVQIPTGLSTSNLQQIYAYILSQQSSTSQAGAVYNKGEVFSFNVPINVNVSSPGDYIANATISFVDVWGNIREYNLTIPIHILGSVKIINVTMQGVLDIKSKFANVTLTLVNEGSSDAYDLQIKISPPSTITGTTSNSILIPTPSLFYIPKLEPYRPVTLPITVAFNPLGYQSISGGLSIISLGSIPFNIEIDYKDPQGTAKMQTETVAVAIEPFVDLVFSESKAEAISGVVRVTGILINYGSSTAYRVKIEAFVGNFSSSYFVGDIEPGNQNAFRVDIPAGPGTSSGYVTLIASYYNIYNELKTRAVNLSIIYVASNTSTTTAMATQSPIEFRIVALILIGFLIVASYFIYRLYKSHATSLKMEMQ